MRSSYHAGLTALGLCLLWFAGCETTVTNAPPISPALLRATRERTDIATLTAGRSVLVNRCIECHAIPAATRFEPDRLRKILETMSNRAKLSPAEHEAVLRYLLAVRSLQIAQ